MSKENDFITKKYKFNLAPGYCLYNGIVIKEQKGAEIKFLIENKDDEILKGRISRAFCNHLSFVIRQADCDENFRRLPRIEFEESNRDVLRQYVSRLYGVENDFDNGFSNEFNIEEKIISESDRRKKEAAAVLLLDSILFEARKKEASDIHIEKNVVRLRIKGKLENILQINRDRKNELIQRIKLLSGMNALEKRRNQDGHFVYGDEKPLFVRVSSVSVIDNKFENDESVVLRLLDSSRIPLSISFLGFNQLQIEKIREITEMKNGLVLVGGPTCSGKSTTVASILIEIEKRNFGKVKIISLEDPPEYIIPGVTQLKVNDDLGKGFENELDYLFRQDPDVIMIGEIRDKESAETAIRAALTGHLVFGTVHTGSAGECVLRLENLGIGRKIITSVLKCVIMQNLNYIEENVSLYADVAVANYDFSWVVNENMGEEEIDEYYNHYTNYIDSLSKNIRLLGKIKKERKFDWRGENYGREIHKNIV